MPLAPPVLTALIVTEMSLLPFVVPNADLTLFANAIATAVVTHITTSAAVVGLATAVTPGPGTAPVTGTVT